MIKRTTSFESNCKLENNPVAIAFAKEVISKRYPGCRIEKVEDRERQLLGIDYIVHTPNGPINIDVKIRKGCESYWGCGQDVLIETRQGKSDVGWGTNPDLKTDFVLYLFPWGDKRRYKRAGWATSLWLPHDYIQRLCATNHGLSESRRGWNGYAYSYCISPTLQQLGKFWDSMDYRLPHCSYL
jgi:hypothetical protein